MRTIALALSTLALCIAAAPRASAGTAENVRLARRVFLENMAQGHFEGLQDTYAPGFVAHGASARYTLEQDVAATRSWHAAMPDLKVAVMRTVAAQDLVAVHWHAVGTNTVAAGGMPGKGDRVGIEGMTFFRFVGGRIAEEWSVVDIATLSRLLE